MQDEDTPSSASLIRQAWGYFPVGVNYAIIAAIFIAAIVIGGQRLGFWLDTQNLHHQQSVQKLQNSIIQNAPNVQQGYVAAVSKDVTDMDTEIINSSGQPNQSMMLSQAVGIGDQACLEASYLTGSYDVSAQMQSWISSNCSGGTLTVSAATNIREGKEN